jgi:hypothetical protein
MGIRAVQNLGADNFCVCYNQNLPLIKSASGMVHVWVGQKLVKSNIFTSFIQCHKVAIKSQFYICDT